MNKDFDMTLFEPDAVLPAQISWGARCDGTVSGARALMVAILEDAMLCIARGQRRRHRRTQRLAAEAETWMRSDDREWLFSFASICDVVGIDPDAVRDRLMTHVELRASGGRTAHPEANEPPTRSGAVVRMLPQRASAQGTNGGGRGTGAGSSVRASVRVA